MNVCFRVDSSTKIGSGHLMRCLTLADQFKEKGAKISFISTNYEGDLFHLMQQKGYRLFRLERVKSYKESQWSSVNWVIDAEETIEKLININSVDWLIIDNYDIDQKWEKRVRSYVKKIMVIDDLANRTHDCDVLLDQNFYINMDTRYQDLVPVQCKILLGPKYVLLRDEFYEARKKVRQRDGFIRRILICFGGSDSTNETEKTIEAIKDLKMNNIQLDVVVGALNPHKQNIKHICSNLSNTNFYFSVENMAELMSKADLAIGAGGSMTWERCILGLPTVTIIVAENQDKMVHDLASIDAIWNLGYSKEIRTKDITELLLKIFNNPNEVKQKSLSCLELMKESSLENINQIF